MSFGLRPILARRGLAPVGSASQISSTFVTNLLTVGVRPPTTPPPLQTLDASDEFRIKMTEQLLEKLFSMGIINTKKSLAKTETASVSAFCRYKTDTRSLL